MHPWALLVRGTHREFGTPRLELNIRCLVLRRLLHSLSWCLKCAGCMTMLLRLLCAPLAAFPLKLEELYIVGDCRNV